MLTYSNEIAAMNWVNAAELFRIALGKRDPEKLRRAFESSSAKVIAYDDTRLVGMGRALCDGEYQAAIYDVVVHPDCQRRGIGTQLMKRLIEQLPVDNIILYAVPGKEAFYTKTGFRKMLTAMAILHPWMADKSRGYLSSDHSSRNPSVM